MHLPSRDGRRHRSAHDTAPRSLRSCIWWGPRARPKSDSHVGRGSRAKARLHLDSPRRECGELVDLCKLPNRYPSIIGLLPEQHRRSCFQVTTSFWICATLPHSSHTSFPNVAGGARAAASQQRYPIASRHLSASSKLHLLRCADCIKGARSFLPSTHTPSRNGAHQHCASGRTSHCRPFFRSLRNLASAIPNDPSRDFP